MEFKVPDILSVSRAAASLLLLLLEPLSDEFLIAFTLIDSTYLVDGFLARRFGISSYGKALDSSCDAVLAVVLLLCLIPNLDWEQWMIWWIAAIA
ncbi:MAG: CDP-alcohol phosphatidyltransferase family protein, partial [Methanomethylophilus sp.]|nr:CDP-alcohol phosphatidyltransferase family protein [Methanomethylophilus sp.]